MVTQTSDRDGLDGQVAFAPRKAINAAGDGPSEGRNGRSSPWVQRPTSVRFLETISGLISQSRRSNQFGQRVTVHSQIFPPGDRFCLDSPFYDEQTDLLNRFSCGSCCCRERFPARRMRPYNPRLRPMEIDRNAASGEAPPAAELCLLGGFRLVTSRGPMAVGSSGQRLLALLALEARPAHRGVVVGKLWPDLPQNRALANLRSVVWRLPRPDSRPLLHAAGPSMLTLGSVGVDHRRMVQEIRFLLRESSKATQLSIGDLTAELLPGWDDDWVVLERESLRQLRLHALEALCLQYSRSGAYQDAIEAGVLAVRMEPLRESAHRTLISAHLAEGNQFEALSQYQRLRTLLYSELGIEPSPATQRLLWSDGDAVLTEAWQVFPRLGRRPGSALAM